MLGPHSDGDAQFLGLIKRLKELKDGGEMKPGEELQEPVDPITDN